jgi:hypothetical protein
MTPLLAVSLSSEDVQKLGYIAGGLVVFVASWSRRASSRT